MYYFQDIERFGITTRHIFRYLLDGAVETFPDVESNTGPERAAFLAWVAAGNSPEPWEG